ncbi:MAG: DUF86 domain-containing protein [Acidobacteria bacterium]|nr:DUF86 domain-containing protein [Acidobacteriota bacterium]MBV9071960.1 DUF86 domain-containing protein [Acidobacteriota bacterium]MBV9186378.1 DUF86 domain-containing protein [Acidobacteriota bacterium]
MGDMLDFCNRLDKRLRGVEKEKFDTDEDLQIIIIHIVQNIGEAARRVSEATRLRHPQIEWMNIVGMRNRLVHDYTNINLDAVWKAATVEVPRLAAELKAFMPSDPP